MRSGWLLVVTTSAALVVQPARAQQHPNLAKGFQADRVYRVDGVDNVNVFNGNLTLTIPMGTEFPGNGALRYGLHLVYNSKNWDYLIESYYQDEHCVTNPPECNAQYIKAIPSRRSNAGMGWLLSMGRLYAPRNVTLDSAYWTYESADGADHAFSLASSCDPTTGGICYTKDGSYFRLKKSSTNDLLVEFPDGMVHSFELTGTGGLHRLTKIQDRFGNHLDICYSTACGGTNDN